MKGKRSKRYRTFFLNCPFDAGYRPVMEMIIFTLIINGYIVRSALEFEYGEDRLGKIVKLIKNCDYAIHDISMVALDSKTNLPRMNMPFELGLFIGIANGKSRQKKKDFLIFGHDKHKSRDAMSDIAGFDVSAHNNDPKTAMQMVRNFLPSINDKSKQSRSIHGDAETWKHYENFLKQLPLLCDQLGLVHGEFHFNDYVNLVIRWLRQNASLFP